VPRQGAPRRGSPADDVDAMAHRHRDHHWRRVLQQEPPPGRRSKQRHRTSPRPRLRQHELPHRLRGGAVDLGRPPASDLPQSDPIDRGNLVVAEITAREMGRLTLVEALELTARVARRDPKRHRRFAARWLFCYLSTSEDHDRRRRRSGRVAARSRHQAARRSAAGASGDGRAGDVQPVSRTPSPRCSPWGR
jgi:hypothetical protein